VRSPWVSAGISLPGRIRNTTHPRSGASTENLREREVQEVETIFKGYGLEGEGLRHIVEAISNNRQRWVVFMMRFELDLERPDPTRAPISAATIAVFYLVGGLITLAPYIFTSRMDLAFRVSVLLTGLALVVFGAVKGRLTGLSVVKVKCADGGRRWPCRRSGLLPGVTVRVIAKRIVCQDVLALITRFP
jgi:VIT family